MKHIPVIILIISIIILAPNCSAPKEIQSIDERYITLIFQADQYFEKQDWERAKKLYKEAYEMRLTGYAREQMIRVQCIQYDENRKENCKRIIEIADEYVLKKEYEKAINLYKRAIELDCYSHSNDSVRRNNIHYEIEKIKVLKSQ